MFVRRERQADQKVSSRHCVCAGVDWSDYSHSIFCSLQTRLRETDDQLSSTETTLRGKEEQLRKMEETVTAEKQVYGSYISL